MSLLTGSPLGLVGLTSKSNASSDAYNSGLKQTGGVEERISLFTGGSSHKFWPNIGKIGTNQDTTGLDNSYNGIDREELHNDSVYDTSLVNIIEKLKDCPKAALKPMDFAYLKNIGVYPNNRLMIARRFTTPMKDNIMDKSGEAPRSVLISWKPETKEFLEFSFGEHWRDVPDTDYTNVLNKMGKKILGGKIGSKIGGYLAEGAGIMPLPGYTEVGQRQFYEKIGLLEKGSSDDILPAGNPNIIRDAKQRKIIGYGEAGSGLKCNIKIQMDVEYEQKFISGVDPTVAWMDILSNVLSFGTSDSSTYGLSKNFSAKLDEWTSDPSKLVYTLLEALSEAFESIKKVAKSLRDNPKETISEAAQKVKDAIDIPDGTTILNFISKSISALVRMYKVEIMGITHALSGAPSTPWHITIGNPLRPIFCSGDMLTQDVTVTLGSTLAFNDLPSTIKVSFTLENARPLGMQEILAKFNTGYLRVSTVRKDFIELEDNLSLIKSAENAQKEREVSDNYYAGEADKVAAQNSASSLTSTSPSGVNVIGTTKASALDTPALYTTIYMPGIGNVSKLITN